MARITINDLPDDMKLSLNEMRRISGGYTDKEIMPGSAIPDNPFGYDSGDDSGSSSSSSSGSSGTSFTFPDVCKIPPPPADSIPIPYPNLGKAK